MTDNEQMHDAMLRIPHDHPCLPGHFPGRPIVPGVVLLDRVLGAAERWLGRALVVKSLLQVKFIAPLLPDETAHLQLRLVGEELRFTLTREQESIAQPTAQAVTQAIAMGAFRLAPEIPA